MADTWRIVHECDDDDGNPTQWAREINDEIHGKYAWIDISEHGFSVSTGLRDNIIECKSLTSAKRWVARNFNL